MGKKVKILCLSALLLLLPLFAFSSNENLFRSSRVTEQEWKEAISSSLADPLTTYKNNLKSCEKIIRSVTKRDGKESEISMIYDFNAKTQLSQITAAQQQGNDEIKVEYTYFPMKDEDKFLSGYTRYFRNNVFTSGEWFCIDRNEKQKPEVQYRSRISDQFMYYNSYGVAQWISVDMGSGKAYGYAISNEMKTGGMNYSDFEFFIFDEEKRLGKFITEINAMDDYTRTVVTIDYPEPEIIFPISSLMIQQAASCPFFSNEEFQRKFVMYFLNAAKK